MRVLLIGNSSGRLDCIAEAITRSKRQQLFILTNVSHVGLTTKGFVTCGPTANPDFVGYWADLVRAPYTVAIISNEEPLAAGVVDKLVEMGIPTVGPTQALARIETSKIYARNLCTRFKIPVNPLWGQFGPENELTDISSWMHALGDFVIKPDGLTGGKGVRVIGDHFQTLDEGISYAIELKAAGQRFIVEEKMLGVEFSLMSMCGDDAIETFAIQDHKRLLEGDEGPNTGGMGSYALPPATGEATLPFVSPEEFDLASEYNWRVAQALRRDNGVPFRGVLYGNYMLTDKGLRLIEFNARFGDPEALNLLPLLESDFVDLLWAMANGWVAANMLRFRSQATVCKYLVPTGYPDDPVKGEKLDLSGVEPHPGLRIYRSGLDRDLLTGSRAVAMVGIADTLEEAEEIAERACTQVPGPLYHRRDIGTRPLVESRIGLLNALRA